MTQRLFIIILSLLISPGASASEIFGQISTNPNALSGGQNQPLLEEPPVTPATSTLPAPVIINNPAPVILPIINQQKSQSVENQSVENGAEVLGVKIYPDGSLLRASDHKIYFIQGQAKKYLANLRELEKYRGRAITEATAEELSGYQDRGYLDSELIRQKGDAKVYVIVKGSKRHILNLEELRAHYFGKEIFNISREEMALY